MDIDARIERRRRRDDRHRLIRDYRSLSPVVHVDEPAGRGPALERVLDHLDPAFDGRLPPNAYVHGPFGAGKSAVVTALFAHLRRFSTETRSVVHTSTRAPSRTVPEFVYVDMRRQASDFAFYHSVLDALVEDPVPEQGVSTGELRARLRELLGESRAGVVVGVDHVGDGSGGNGLVELFAGLPGDASWLAVGRADPGETGLTGYTETSIRVDRYRRQTLVDVLTARSSEGLARGALDHGQARRIADWADGNAHDALLGLFAAADRADRADRTRLGKADVDAALGEVPSPAVSLGRVLALPASKQLVLRALVDLDAAERGSVAATAGAVSADPGVDLSPGTIERFLYEMAEDGVVERVRAETRDGKGRPPSRVDLRFPPTAFRRLYDLRE